MFLRRLAVKNFRALADIEADFDKPINVIVGPNASGKTTVLEAIRLAKALLAPRTPTESNQSLTAIGAMSPHLPGRLLADAIARDQQFPTEIRTLYAFSDTEIEHIAISLPQIATNVVQAQAGQQFATPASLISFLSSPLGVEQLRQAENQIKEGLNVLRRTKECSLNLIIDYRSGRLSGTDPISQSFFSFFGTAKPTQRGVFQLFPCGSCIATW